MRTRVYYADTDAGGVVYYANYLRWLEMSRCDWLATTGTSAAEFVQQGYVFAVAKLEIDYVQPAVLGDEIEVTIRPTRVRHVRFMLEQQVLRTDDRELLASAHLTMACLSPEGKIQALPKELAQWIKQQLPE